MNKNGHFLLIIWLGCLSLGLTTSQTLVAEDHLFSSEDLSQLSKTLDRKLDGWRANEIRKYFERHRFERIGEMFKLNVTEPLVLSNRKYSHFTEAYAMRLARRFSGRWRTMLKRAERKFGVDREVIVGILLVETSFGRITGQHNLFSVYASTYLDSYELTRSAEFQSLDSKLQQRVQRKMEWALDELTALFKIAKRYENLKIATLKGSYAGAFGLCQFLPSSYLNYAVSAEPKRSPTPNLFWQPDAIYSVAHYLSQHGFRKPADSDAARKAIFAYNNSDVYVDTVLAVRAKLKDKY